MLRHYLGDSPELRPLSQLPALAIADGQQDVRGWPVVGHDNRALGRVADLLVDVDRLTADFLVVSVDESTVAAGAQTVVPLAGLERDDARRRLVTGRGMRTIHVRYQSTVSLSVWMTIAALLLFVLSWALGLIGA